MQLMFLPEPDFEDDLCRLDDRERTEVIERINYACAGAACGDQNACSLITCPGDLRLRDGCRSSLSILPAGRRSAVILTVDQDPIFDQVVVSLFRVVRKEQAGDAYRECAQKLHKIDPETTGPGTG